MKQTSLFKKVVASVLAMKAFADAYPSDFNSTTSPFTELIRTVHSREIEYKALPLMRFFQFATLKIELEVEPGLTIQMLTYDNLKLGGALTEGESMKTQAMSGSTKEIKVTEYGNAISVTEKMVHSSFDDVMASADILLGRDYAMVLDCSLRDAALSGTNVVYAAKSDGTKVTSRNDLTADAILKVSTIKDAVEILATNNAPKYGGANWICFVHPHQSRALRDDPNWVEAVKYGDPDRIYYGEIGRIDDVLFIETTLMVNGANTQQVESYDATMKATDGTAVYQAVLFGDAYYAVAFSLPVELRDNGVEDFGRKRSLAWYSIFGVAKLHDNYGVVIETA